MLQVRKLESNCSHVTLMASLIGGIQINKTCWCVLMIPIILMSTWTVFKLSSSNPDYMSNYLVVPTPSSRSRITWKLSNETVISIEHRHTPAEVKSALIINHGSTTALSAQELCAAKERIEINTDAFCLLDKCSVANLTKNEKINLY